MKSLQQVYVRIAISLSALTVVFLVPSAGLSTLLAPDDRDGANVSLFDNTHLGKRGVDTPEKLVYVSHNTLHIGAFSSRSSTIADAAIASHTISPNTSTVRGPPA